MTGFSAKPTLRGLKPFQRRTVSHVHRRFYTSSRPTDRFLVADETGLGKSVVAAGVVARAIEHGLAHNPGQAIVSVNNDVVANGPAEFPSASADGALVAFESTADNLTDGDANGTTGTMRYIGHG